MRGDDRVSVGLARGPLQGLLQPWHDCERSSSASSPSAKADRYGTASAQRIGVAG